MIAIFFPWLAALIAALYGMINPSISRVFIAIIAVLSLSGCASHEWTRDENPALAGPPPSRPHYSPPDLVPVLPHPSEAVESSALPDLSAPTISLPPVAPPSQAVVTDRAPPSKPASAWDDGVAAPSDETARTQP